MARERKARRQEGHSCDEFQVLLTSFGRRLEAIEEAVGAIRRLVGDRAVEKERYTTSDLAEALNVSQYTVTERWCNAGRIEAEKDPDTGKWHIPAREFDRLVKGGGLKPKRHGETER